MGSSAAQVLAQVQAWLPVTQLLTGFYGSNPGFCNMILDTAFSLIAAIFAFIILPAGDFLIGQEPPEAVRSIGTSWASWSSWTPKCQLACHGFN